MSADIINNYGWSRGLVLASGGPEMLLNISQCIEKLPRHQTKNYPVLHVNSTEFENLCSGQSQVHRSPYLAPDFPKEAVKVQIQSLCHQMFWLSSPKS